MIRPTLFRSAMLAGLLGAPMLAAPLPAAAYVSIGISVGIAPPPLPVYEQPIAPGPGYIWTPGYWAWDPAYGYYWVPGSWVLPPEIGVLWTPGWWGWDAGYYRWHPGYWGPRVGFYGGINYGYGYFGAGYVGGHWRGHDFYYNRAVNNINVTNIRNVYVDKTVVNNYRNATVTRVSYNGGRGGVTARATPAQLAAAKERHFDPTPLQLRQRDLAKTTPAQRFSVNHGRPQVVATPRPGNFASAHAVRNAAIAPPHAANPTGPHATPSMARPSDGFVHAPHASARTTTQSAHMTPSHAAPVKRSSDNFVHAPPHANSATAPRNGALPPHDRSMSTRNEAVPSRNREMSTRSEAVPSRNRETAPHSPHASYQRHSGPPQMPQHQAKPYAAPQQNHAPLVHEPDRKPPSKHDHQNDGH